MHWSLFVLIGASINVVVNAGYKVLSVKDAIFFYAALVLAVSSVTLLGYAWSLKMVRVSDITIGWTPLVLIAMGVGSSAVMVFFIKAVSGGSISLVDPLWACIYALVSVLIGMALLKETPSLVSLCGIGLYLIGAFLMSRG